MLSFLSGLIFWYPVEKLFLRSIGVGPLGISVNAIVFLAVMVIFDVPAGVLADKWRRKYVLVSACVALLVASLIAGSSHSLPVYLIATALVGAYMVLTSGTTQAMMYDSLKETESQKTYDKHQGWAYALYLAGFGFSSIAGGYIAQHSGYRASYWITAVAMAAALIVSLTLAEPVRTQPTHDKKLSAHVRESVTQILAQSLLMQLGLLIVAVTILRSTQNEYAPLLFVALGLGAVPIGYATAAKWLTSSLGQIIAPKAGRRVLKLSPLFFIGFTLFSIVHTRWSLLFFFIVSFLYAAITNQAESAVQDLTASDIRATMLSVLNFASNIVLIPLSLLFGWVAQHSNVFNAYTTLSVVGILYLIMWLVSGRRSFHVIYDMRPRHEQAPSAEVEIV